MSNKTTNILYNKHTKIPIFLKAKIYIVVFEIPYSILCIAILILYPFLHKSGPPTNSMFKLSNLPFQHRMYIVPDSLTYLNN